MDVEELSPKELSSDIAKRITALRLQRAWTREVLAERSNVNVYTLKHFERTGQISLHRLISIASALEVYSEVERIFKPRQRVDVNNWQIEPQTTRKRGRRRKVEEIEAARNAAQQQASAQTVAEPLMEEVVS